MRAVARDQIVFELQRFLPAYGGEGAKSNQYAVFPRRRRGGFAWVKRKFGQALRLWTDFGQTCGQAYLALHRHLDRLLAKIANSYAFFLLQFSA